MTFKLRDTFLEDGFYVTQNYMNNPAYYKQFNLLGHEGLDLGHTDKTKKARTPLAGTCFLFTDKNYGEAVVIENYEQKCAIYLCHMQKIEVVNGQVVNTGDVIGEMDDTGNANGEHVHFNFVILDDRGSNKYKKKEYNWGFLDPQYPRDTGKTVKFPGVEEYTIEWDKGDQSPAEPPKPVQEPTVEAPSNKELSEQISGVKNDVKNIQNSVNVLYEDREILTKLSAKMVALNDEFQSLKETINTHMKDIKADVQELPDKMDESVKDSVEVVADAINKKENVIVIIPDQAKSFINTLISLWRSIWKK